MRIILEEHQYAAIQNILTEQAAVSDVQKAILNHNIVEISYDDGLIGTRRAEIYALGNMPSGTTAIRAFQLSGPTKTGNNKWKIFDISKIKTMRLLPQTFSQPRPNFNKTGDRTFSNTILIAKFDNKTLMQKAGDYLKTGVDKVKSLFKSHQENTLNGNSRILVERFLDEYNVNILLKEGEVMLSNRNTITEHMTFGTKTVDVYDDWHDEVIGKKNVKTFRYTDEMGGEAYGDIDGRTASIIGMNSEPINKKTYNNEPTPLKRRGFFRTLLYHLTLHDVDSLIISMQSNDTKNAVNRLLQTGELHSPSNYHGLSTHQHPRNFKIDAQKVHAAMVSKKLL